MSTLKSRYMHEIKSWDWKIIVESAMNNTHVDYDGNIIGSDYLGSVFSLVPSGKYYLPFACSNLTPCSKCKGSGLTVKLYDCEFCHGSGIRSYQEIADITGESIESVALRLCVNADWQWIDNEHFACFSCHGSGKVNHTCASCGGLGSNEAYHDSIFYDCLDAIADLHDGYIESGEGDSTDIYFSIFIGESVSDSEDDNE